MDVRDRGPEFEEKGFPHKITMVLARLEPWEFSAVRNRAVRSAAAIREGGAAVVEYGFDAEEFEVLKDPDTWEGIADYIYAVELAVKAIKSWTGVSPQGGSGAAEVTRGAISWLFRIKAVREHFLSVMTREGERYLAAEGNA